MAFPRNSVDDRTQRLARPLALAAGVVIAVAACTGTGAATGAPATLAPATPTPSEQASGGAMAVVTKGDFHAVDGTASGIAELVTLPDGSYEVILDAFAIAGIEHTSVVLVSNADIVKTTDIDQAKLLDLGPLKAREGMQTYPIPTEMAGSVMEGYHTVVIWDTAMLHALAAAPLK